MMRQCRGYAELTLISFRISFLVRAVWGDSPRAIRLDFFLDLNLYGNVGTIDFLWMDVEGAEIDVILGGKKTLEHHVRFIYTEYADTEIHKGQIGLKDILAALPSFRFVRSYGNNALLKNTKF
jgi:hypothetical protein